MSQAPRDNTIDDFWQMCFQYNVKVIIMLCKEEEDGTIKSSKYWDLNNSNYFQNVKTNEVFNDEIIIRKELEITRIKDNKTMFFSHLQFKKWPDHMAPDIQNVVHNFEKIFTYLNENNKENQVSIKHPIVIHCSAGIGRSGVFIALYLLYKEIMENILNKQDVITFNIFNLVRKLKEMRRFSVENINQYNFIYLFINELLIEKNVPCNNQAK